MRMLNGYVLLRPEAKEKETESGIILTQSDTHIVNQAEVVQAEDTELVGKKVIYKQYAAIEHEEDGEILLIIDQDNITAVYE